MYGLAHCSTCQKAQAELEAAGWQVDFRDVKTDPLSGADWQALIAGFGDKLVNRAGTTFRKLDEAQKADLDEAKAIELMLAQPSMIKRPVLELGGRTLVGFKPDAYAAALA